MAVVCKLSHQPDMLAAALWDGARLQSSVHYCATIIQLHMLDFVVAHMHHRLSCPRAKDRYLNMQARKRYQQPGSLPSC